MNDDLVRHTLQTVRLLGHGTRERVVERVTSTSGATTSDVVIVLEHVERSGWALERSGPFPGWSLTAAGRTHGEALLAAELDARSARPQFVVAYKKFLPINQEFLVVCTDWQLRSDGSGTQIINDHRDLAHDRGVLDRLGVLDAHIAEILGDLTAGLDRFGRYRQRFSQALVRIEQGDLDWFTKPVIESYHTVWFELHEDLLATLGIDRSAER